MNEHRNNEVLVAGAHWAITEIVAAAPRICNSLGQDLSGEEKEAARQELSFYKSLS